MGNSQYTSDHYQCNFSVASFGHLLVYLISNTAGSLSGPLCFWVAELASMAQDVRAGMAAEAHGVSGVRKYAIFRAYLDLCGQSRLRSVAQILRLIRPIRDLMPCAIHKLK